MQKQKAISAIKEKTGIVPLQDIINIFLSIDNFKQETLSKLNPAKPYTEQGCIPLDEIYVDLSYQRTLQPQQVLNRLITWGGFDKDVAGHIDIAQRNDGRYYVWDGFHRAIKASIVGLKDISASIYVHDKTLTPTEERQKEAKMFKIRNADMTKMKPEEIFKSEVVFNDPEAMKILDVLKACKLDVEGTNPDENAGKLSGFALLRKTYDKIDIRHMRDASEMIQHTWNKENNVSLILWIALAQLLQANESDIINKTASVFELRDALVEYVNNNNLIQSSFTQPRLHGKATESTAVNLLNRVFKDIYNDNGREVKTLIKHLGVDEDMLYDG